MPFHVLNKDSDTDSDDDFSDIFDDGGFNFTMLCSAIQRSDLARVQSFLSRGVNPNKRGPSGIPLLNVACQTGDARIVRALLNWRADMSGVNKVGGTPLMEAAAFGHLPLVKFLAGIGANPETKSRKGNTALDIARREGQYSVVGFLEGLKLEGCHPGVTCDKSGMMPIVGLRYKMFEHLHEDYDLCEAEYQKLPASGQPLSQEMFRCIAPKTFSKSLPKGKAQDVDLLKAAKLGDVETVGRLLADGIGTDVTDMVLASAATTPRPPKLSSDTASLVQRHPRPRQK